MKFDCDDQFAWFVMSYDLQRRLGAKPWESEDFLTCPVW